MKGFIKGECATEDRVHGAFGECDVYERQTTGLIFHGNNASFPSQEEEFNEAIEKAIYLPGIERVTPIYKSGGAIVENAQSGGDLRTSDVGGFGGTIYTGRNQFVEIYKIVSGGECLYKQLKKLDTQFRRVFRIDASKKVWGTVEGDDDASNFRGFSVQIGVYKTKSDGTNTPASFIALAYQSDAEDDNMASVNLTADIKGINGVVLSKTGSGKAKLVRVCSGEDYTTVYKDKLGEVELYIDKAGKNPETVAYANDELTFTPKGIYKPATADAFHKVGIEGIEGENIYTDLS